MKILHLKNYQKIKYGNYNKELKKITIQEGLTEDFIKSVIFHEMIHVVMNRGQFVGFEKEYVVEDLGKMNVTTAVGITEGFTQYITNQRDQIYFKNNNKNVSYPILTELTEELINLTGKDKFLNMAFNCPDQISNTVCDKKSSEELLEVNNIIDDFDIILKYEKTLYKNRGNTLLKRIFGKDIYKLDEDNKNGQLVSAKDSIIKFLIEHTLPEKIQSLEEFERIYRKIQKYNEKLNYGGNFETFNLLFEKLNQINGTIEEKLLKLPNDISDEIKLKLKIDAFLEKDKQEQLQIMADEEKQDYYDIYDSEFQEHYMRQMIFNIFEHQFNMSNEDIYSLLNSGLAKMIIDRKYNIKTLAIEQIGFEEGLKRYQWYGI